MGNNLFVTGFVDQFLRDGGGENRKWRFKLEFLINPSKPEKSREFPKRRAATADWIWFIPGTAVNLLTIQSNPAHQWTSKLYRVEQPPQEQQQSGTVINLLDFTETVKIIVEGSRSVPLSIPIVPHTTTLSVLSPSPSSSQTTKGRTDPLRTWRSWPFRLEGNFSCLPNHPGRLTFCNYRLLYWQHISPIARGGTAWQQEERPQEAVGSLS